MVLIVALLVLGPTKLPDAARSLGRAIGEVRRYTNGFQNEMRDAFSEPRVSASEPSRPAPSKPDNGDASAS